MNKSTRTVDFDFAQPTNESRVERSDALKLLEVSKLGNWVHSFSEIALVVSG